MGATQRAGGPGTGGQGGEDKDADDDGSDRPADCDDNNPDVHPGAAEDPGNAVDEDCAGGPQDPPTDGDKDGVFTPDESRGILEAGRRLGMKPRIHADELALSGGSRVAAEVGARSADHLIT